jgi:hypothetical protein
LQSRDFQPAKATGLQSTGDSPGGGGFLHQKLFGDLAQPAAKNTCDGRYVQATMFAHNRADRVNMLVDEFERNSATSGVCSSSRHRLSAGQHSLAETQCLGGADIVGRAQQDERFSSVRPEA